MVNIKKEEAIKVIPKETSAEKKTDLSLLVISVLLLITLSGIAYLYFTSKKPPKFSAPPRGTSGAVVQNVDVKEGEEEPQSEPPTLTPERLEIIKKIKDHLVKIDNGTLSEATLTISLHDQVTWENLSGETYQIQGDDWGGVPIENGERFAQAFEKKGSFPYSCALHPELKGTIVVE